MTSLTLEEAEKLFTKLFEQQLTSFMNIIAGNREIFSKEIADLSNEIVAVKTMISTEVAAIKEDVKIMKSDIDDLKLSVEHVDVTATTKMMELNSELLKNLEKMDNALNEKINDIQKKQIDLEDRSRRNNIRVDGIEEEENETWDDCKKKVKDIVKEKMGIDVEIQRAHRVGKYEKDRERPRTIVALLLNYGDKENIFKNGKKLINTGIFINEDFSKETMLKRKELREKAKELKKRNIATKIIYNRLIYLNEGGNA